MAVNGPGAKPSGAGRRACCLVSDVLEEAGLDRTKARALVRQVLEGVILLCRWQLERMDPPKAPSPTPGRGRRKVPVE